MILLNKNIKNRGFMALISVIIISAVLLIIASTLGWSGFFLRSDILSREYKERSLSIAEGCFDFVLLELTKNPSYFGGPPDVNIDSGFCTINVFDPSLDPITLKITGVFQNAKTNLEIKISKTDLSLTSWKELANF